jgi:glutathione S-transferase
LKIYYSPTSPFVRKCLVAAAELGITDRIERLPAAAHPIDRDRTVMAHNPLGKVPTLLTDDGAVLYDSRVICEYFDTIANGSLVPRDAPARWNVLVLQALADGINDAAVLARYEAALRPEALRWNEWAAGQVEKVTCGLAEIERQAAGFGDRVDLGIIAVGCALGYLDFRFASLAWRTHHPATAAWFARFDARPSMVATRPPAG